MQQGGVGSSKQAMQQEKPHLMVVPDKTAELVLQKAME